MEPDTIREAFLGTQYLAYLGNKRALLPFLHGIFQELIPNPVNSRFGDLFAGAGSVSRLALTMGCMVHANDWEDYAVCVNRAWLISSSSLIDQDFHAIRHILNGLHPVLDDTLESTFRRSHPTQYYISKHFAPHTTATGNYRNERLFYTHENAVFLDRARSWIESELPAHSPYRELFLGLLLFVAARQANTNGVFKSFHRGFGGHGHNALERIMSPMVLPIPVLWKAANAAEITGLDAKEACRGRSYDLAYLDPPYNIHQYGSNYFLLNSLYRWDCPEVNEARDGEGKLVFRAGIRSDWIQTRSPWCLSRQARPALKSLLDELDARHVVLSYSADGIIPIDEMLDLLASYGQPTIRTKDYTSFRGGRQSTSRRMSTAEFAFILKRDTNWGRVLADPSREMPTKKPGSLDFLIQNRIQILMDSTHDPDRLLAAKRQHGTVSIPPAWENVRFDRSPDFRRNPPIISWLASMESRDLITLEQMLAASVCRSRGEELTIWLQLLTKNYQRLKRSASRFGQKRILFCLSKIAYFKYQSDFKRFAQAIGELIHTDPEEFLSLHHGLEKLQLRMQTRSEHHLARQTKKDREESISKSR